MIFKDIVSNGLLHWCIKFTLCFPENIMGVFEIKDMIWNDLVEVI